MPDAPVSSFEAILPQGPHSALTANVPEKENYSLCKTSLQMPTEITGQNGAVITQKTPITTTGCTGVLSSKTKLTKAQMLAKALKACRIKYRHSRARRAGCEKQAHRKYPGRAAVHETSKTHGHGKSA